MVGKNWKTASATFCTLLQRHVYICTSNNAIVKKIISFIKNSGFIIYILRFFLCIAFKGRETYMAKRLVFYSSMIWRDPTNQLQFHDFYAFQYMSNRKKM